MAEIAEGNVGPRVKEQVLKANQMSTLIRELENEEE